MAHSAAKLTHVLCLKAMSNPKEPVPPQQPKAPPAQPPKPQDFIQSVRETDPLHGIRH